MVRAAVGDQLAVPLAHGVVAVLALVAVEVEVRSLQLAEPLDQRLRVVADRAEGGDQLVVEVVEHGLARPPLRVRGEAEEERAAAEEGLVVGIDARGGARDELVEDLGLAAGPLEERTSGSSSLWRLVGARGRGGSRPVADGRSPAWGPRNSPRLGRL